jgi:ferredoxin-type protein NapH
MSRFLDQYRVMLGGEPRKPAPADYSPEALDIHTHKRTPEERRKRAAAIREELAHPQDLYTWRIRRWTSIVVVNLLFVVSYHFDVQLVEGALTASRFVGFHMADLNSALQVVLAYKELLINLLIGIVTVGLMWWLVGGRSFCAWACPYHLLAELAEMLHLKLAAKGWVSDHPLHRGTRTVLYVIFALLALVTGYTVFETISPVGILSRALIYGASWALVFVGVLLLIEVLFIRRFWCRYICPIGLTYGMIGSTSPVVVQYDLKQCFHEGKCRSVCMVPHVIDMTIKGRADEPILHAGADCTRCGRCVEVCPTGALTFKIRGTGGLI